MADNEPMVPVWDTADAVPEAFRSNVYEADGRFALNIDIDKHPKVTPLVNAYAKVKDEAKGLKAQLAQVKDAATAYEAELNELREKAGKGDKDLDARLAQVREKYEGQIKAEGEKMSAVVSQLDGLILTDAATKAIVAMAPDGVHLLLPHVLAQARIEVASDGTRKAVVVDANGTPRIADTLGTPMGFEALVKEMSTNPVYAPCFPGRVSPGGGGKPSQHGGTPTKKLADLRNEKERSAFIREHGFEAYKKLVDAEYAAAA